MHVLVTGGAGFIGSHLISELLQRTHTVTVIDNLSTGSIKNIEGLFDRPDFSFVEGDVCNHSLLAPLMEEADFCYHLAAVVGVKRIIDKPLLSLQTLVHGTSLVLEAANKYKVPTFVASTSEVYGKHESEALTEQCTSIIGPVKHWRWLYACAKMLDEFWALAYYRENGLPVIIARFFNVSGPRQTGHWGMVVPTFVQQAMNDKPITIYGDGAQKRCFMHVKDCIEAVMRLTENEATVGQIVNIGNSHQYSILELAHHVLEIVPNTKSEIEFISYEDAYGPGFEDMRQRIPDTSLLTKLSGFKPKIHLDNIIRDIYEDLKAHG